MRRDLPKWLIQNIKEERKTPHTFRRFRHFDNLILHILLYYYNRGQNSTNTQ